MWWLTTGLLLWLCGLSVCALAAPPVPTRTVTTLRTVPPRPTTTPLPGPTQLPLSPTPTPTPSATSTPISSASRWRVTIEAWDEGNRIWAPPVVYEISGEICNIRLDSPCAVTVSKQ